MENPRGGDCLKLLVLQVDKGVMTGEGRRRRGNDGGGSTGDHLTPLGKTEAKRLIEFPF